MEPDVLYAVRRGERNEALKYSLRSLANLPHRRVFIAGYCPPWVRGVTAVEGPRRANKFDSIEENVRRGLRHPELADDVVYMNDDFYITRPVHGPVPVTHGGLVDQYLGKQELKIRMRRTVTAFLEGGFMTQFQGFLAYDGVHMPLPLDRTSAIIALDHMPQGCLWRTWYGNHNCIGGIKVGNTKFKAGPGEETPRADSLPTYLSTNNHGLQRIREMLDDLLPRDCPYLEAVSA